MSIFASLLAFAGLGAVKAKLNLPAELERPAAPHLRELEALRDRIDALEDGNASLQRRFDDLRRLAEGLADARARMMYERDALRDELERVFRERHYPPMGAQLAQYAAPQAQQANMAQQQAVYSQMQSAALQAQQANCTCVPGRSFAFGLGAMGA